MKKLLILLTLCLPVFVMAQVPKPQPNTYVNDLTGSMDAGQIRQLNEQIRALETQSSVQFAIVLVNDLPPNMEIEDYAREIGRTWHVGNAKNGIVYVAVLNSHKQRLEIARELEGTLSDMTCRNMTEGIKPFFRKKDYFAGCFYLVQQVQLKIKPVVSEQKALGNAELAKKDANDEFPWGTIFGVFCLIFLVCFIIYQLTKKPKSAKIISLPKRNEDQPRPAAHYNESQDYHKDMILHDSFAKRQKKKKKVTPLIEGRTRSNLKPIIPHHSTMPPPSAPKPHERSSGNGLGTALAAGVIGYELGKMSHDKDDDNSSSSSSSSSSSDNDSSNFGSWGSGSSDSSSPDSSFSSDSSSSSSGFDGGGSSNDW